MGLAHSPQIVTDNLVFCLDAANTKSYPSSGGSTWYDLKNGEYNATITGPSWSNTNSGIFTYDGTDDRVTFDKSTFTLGSNFTIEIWYRFTSSEDSVFANGGLFTQGADGDWNNSVGSNKGLVLGANDIVYHTGSTQVWYSYDNVPSQNNWHQFVFTLDSGTGKVLIDGASSEIYSATNFQSTYSNANGLYGIGLADRYSNNYRGEFIGDISIFRVYNATLTSSEISQNFNALRGRYGI